MYIAVNIHYIHIKCHTSEHELIINAALTALINQKREYDTMSREEIIEKILKILEEYGIIDPLNNQDSLPLSQQTSHTVH